MNFHLRRRPAYRRGDLFTPLSHSIDIGPLSCRLKFEERERWRLKRRFLKRK